MYNSLAALSMPTSALKRLPASLFLMGVGVIVWRNWRQWQRDKQQLHAYLTPEPTPPPDTWPAQPRISILVAAWNESLHIEQHIQSYRQLRYPHKQLVLSAGGEDQTYEMALRYVSDDILVLKQQRSIGPQKALRQAFYASDGEIVFLSDADCYFDDPSFERSVYPLAVGQERACTGQAQPLPNQINNSFVVAQSALHIYQAMHVPPYEPQLRGRNIVLQRAVLEQAWRTAEELPSGWDYLLAQDVANQGIAIRQATHSLIPTEYPATVREYISEQRRWLRNLAVHGFHRRKWDAVWRSVQASLIGLLMLGLPLGAPLFGRLSLFIWLLLYLHALLSRLRYLACGCRVLNIPITARRAAMQVPMLFIEFVCWVAPLQDYLPHKRRWSWSRVWS